MATKRKSAKKVEESSSGLQRRIPFWSSKFPQFKTTIGTSTYHLSGFHSQRMSGSKLVMDNLSLIGQRLDGPDLGPVTITLEKPIKPTVSKNGSFKARAALVMSSGGKSSSIRGEISGQLNTNRTDFTSLCISALAKTSTFALGNGTISTDLRVGLA